MAVISLPNQGGAVTLQEQVAAEVRSLMGRYKVTQIQLAAVLDLPQSAVSARVNGKRPFTLDDLERLAGFFGVEPQEILGGTRLGPRPTPPDGGQRVIRGGRSRASSMDTSGYPDCFAA